MIKAWQLSDHIEVTISDSGAGISAEDIAHIFDRFYQADKSRSRIHTGSGLGLTITREIIQAHRGTIAAQSASGKGSTFRVTLPIQQPDDPTLSKPAGVNRAHGHP